MNRPDWSEWILQKNEEAREEELKKSNHVAAYDTLEKANQYTATFHENPKGSYHTFKIHKDGKHIATMTAGLDKETGLYDADFVPGDEKKLPRSHHGMATKAALKAAWNQIDEHGIK